MRTAEDFTQDVQEGEEQMDRVKLDETAIQENLRSMDGWQLNEEKIAKTYAFDSYSAGVLFAAGVAQVAESMDHHPDIHIGYRQVSLSVNTHDVGGISPFDFELARRVEELARK